MTTSPKDVIKAHKRVRAWVRKPDGTALDEITVDVRYSWEAEYALADAGLIPNADHDISVRQVEGSGDAG